MGRRRKTREELLLDFEKVHGDAYDYSLVDYSVALNKINIRCKKHNHVFQQLPYDHREGARCPLCAVESQKSKLILPLSSFIDAANDVHNFAYDYSKITDYRGTKYSNIIVCKSCGNQFSQVLGNHLRGCGCQCKAGWASHSHYRTMTEAAENLYILQSESMVKVGITRNNVSSRCNDVNRRSPEKFRIRTYYLLTADVAYKIEQKLLEVIKICRFKQPTVKFSGSTECFLNCDVEWVQDLMEAYIDYEYQKKEE